MYILWGVYMGVYMYSGMYTRGVYAERMVRNVYAGRLRGMYTRGVWFGAYYSGAYTWA